MEASRVRRSVLEPGTTLGTTYQVGRLIGQGGMGEVYEARHARLAGRYAVKVIRRELIEPDPVTVQRFQREAEVMSSLRHPNIVQIIDFDVGADGSPFIVMEYLEGSDLQARIAQRGPMPLSEALIIIEQVASALAAAHERGVIHRDLKPANIFLVPLPVAIAGNPTEFVKVLDFGISKVKSAGTLSAKPHMMGTPHYMAPEQARMLNDEIDGRSDQFALAAIAYELLCGRKAFPGDTIEGVLYSVVNQHPPSLAPVVGEAVDRVLTAGLAKERGARHPSITAFVTAMRAAAARNSQTPIAGGTRVGPNITFETGSPLTASLQPPPVAAAPASAATEAAARSSTAPNERAATGLSRRTKAAVAGLALAAVVGVGALALVQRGGETVPTTPSVAELATLGAAVRARVEKVLGDEARALEAQVRSATKIPELRNAAATHIDTFTFNDLFATEEWWQPYRGLATVVFDGESPLVTRGLPDVSKVGGWRLWQAREEAAAPTLLFGDRRAYLAAGAALGSQGTLGLVLASPLDADRLGRLAKTAQVDRLLVSDGKRLFGLAAPAKADDPTAALAGREAQPAVLLPGGRVAVATSRPGGFVWAVSDLPAP